MNEIEDSEALLQVGILQMLSALTGAGIERVSTQELHAFAYFGNVLGGLWDVDAVTAGVLKAEEGPYYPHLQKAIDKLVGCGLVTISRFRYEKGASGRVTLEAEIDSCSPRVGELLSSAAGFPDEENVTAFLTELALAFAEIRKDRRDDAPTVDASFSDPAIPDDRVVYAEWRGADKLNASIRAAERFQKYAPKGVLLNRAEKLLMYMRLIKRRANG